jgi:hypothetical protein
MVNPDLILAHSEKLQNVHYSACCNIELGALSRSE